MSRARPAIRRGTHLAMLLSCVGLLACEREPDRVLPIRFADPMPSVPFSSLEADHELRPTLPRLEPEQRFEVRGAAKPALLTFSAGIDGGEGAGAVRFEILLAPKQGSAVTLYDREFDREGWIDERIDLSGHALDGATLVFRRTSAAGDGGALARSGWGNPMIVPARPSRRPSVILVSLDTLRADRVGTYGYRRARTPTLDALAATGTRYERAYAPSTWTVPSHASILNGAYLPDTVDGVRGRLHVPPEIQISDRPLADLLGGAGYLTAGFTGGGFLGYPWEFFRGFDRYYRYLLDPSSTKTPVEPCGPRRFDGAEVFGRASDWLRRNHERPFFLFVHTYDAHDRCAALPPEMVTGFWPWRLLSPAMLRRAIVSYDHMIASVDRRLAGLLATVDELGLADDTLVIVLSDHGEVFNEHGQVGHGCDMKPYEELARVPLLLRYPGHVPAGGRVGAPVSLIDVPATILALLGLPEEPKLVGGVLPGLGVSDSPRASQVVYCHCGDSLAVWRERHKLVTSLRGRHPDEVYDVVADPRETRNLGVDAPSHAELRQDADVYWKTAIALPNAPEQKIREQELGPAEKQRLRDLGYVE